MGTVTLVNVAAVAGVIVGLGALRRAYANTVGRRTPATQDDMRAIETALAGEGGQVLRASLDRSDNLIARNEFLDERTGARLYHVTLQVGSVRVRRRVAVRNGAPALILP